jgi:hypothetical protein
MLLLFGTRNAAPATVMTGKTVQAASVLWLHCVTEASLPLIGQYNHPTNRRCEVRSVIPARRWSWRLWI